MNHTTTLPIWILMIFCTALIGVITLIYSRGNWRTALAFVGLTIIAALMISGIDQWSDYIKTHFVGQFDQLGIPFREAGPGWHLLAASWPLWLVPTGVFAVLALVISSWLRSYFLITTATVVTKAVTPKETISAETSLSKTSTEPVIEPPQKIARQLELESLKQELMTTKDKLAIAIKIAEDQVDKNQDLEIKIIQLAEEYQDSQSELEEKITLLELEIASKENENNELTAMALHQAEAISKLKDALETP